MLEKKTKTC